MTRSTPCTGHSSHNLYFPSLQAQRLLQAPRYPSYKPFGPTHASVLDACPCNLHTSQIDVLSPSSAPPPPTSPSSSLKQQSNEGTHLCSCPPALIPSLPPFLDDLSSPVVSVDTTSYHISTMACPTPSHTFTVSCPPLSLPSPSPSPPLPLPHALKCSLCRRRIRRPWVMPGSEETYFRSYRHTSWGWWRYRRSCRSEP